MKLFEPYLISKDGRNDWRVWNDYRENLLASCTVVVGMIGEQKNTGKYRKNHCQEARNQ